ncbi:MAG: YdeI/OmpD-associated family protein [Erysipelotrichaceae bacterium]|nr:YdeI/OmpD-associated family protein [Erysipelotrichaceae bacterium]
MKEKKTVYFRDRYKWREWLGENFRSEKEIWFVFPLKGSKDKGVSYNDAVEEALCFGWIDGQTFPLDESHQLRRFTPRRKNSAYSRPNIERLILLDRQCLIHPDIEEQVRDIIRKPYVFPEDIISELKKDKTVWNNYKALKEPYKRIRIAYIDAARKRPSEFRKRLENFISKTRENRIIGGFGGIEKYYEIDDECE